MNWDQIEGNWKQLTGQAREKWGKLTDDDWAVVAGRRDQLTGKLQERYGIVKEAADEQIAAWQRSATDGWFSKKPDQPAPAQQVDQPDTIPTPVKP